MNNLSKLFYELAKEKDFKFLKSSLELNEQLKNTVFNADVKKISVSDKTFEDNFFTNEKEPNLIYHIDDNLSYELYKLLVLQNKSSITDSLLKEKIVNSIQNILVNQKIDKQNLNKEMIVFPFLLNGKTSSLVNKLFINLLQNFMKQVTKNRIEFHDIRFNYTDMCFKLGEVLIKYYIDNIKSNKLIKLFILKNENFTTNKDFYITLLKNNKNLPLFLKNIKQEKNNPIIKDLLELFYTSNEIISNYLYKLFRTYVLYKTYEKNDKLPIEYSEIHLNYTKFIIKFGCLILESFIENKIFIKQYNFKSKNNKIKSPLIIKCYPELINIEMLNTAVHRPYLTKNTLEIIIDKTKNINSNLQEHENNYDYTLEFENALLYSFSQYHKNNFISYNCNMTTEINKNVYLNDKHSLATRFVIDNDYLYSFLNLLKYHMLERKNDVNLTFEDKLKKHENIFLLYQISIESVLEFYNKYKILNEIRYLFKYILTYILNYNVEDTEFIEHYKMNLVKIKNNQKITLTSLEVTKIETFIHDFFNKIFSYKIFIKGLLKECILYSNFRYFILDSFIDTRGRCYYNGFYLNPQSYPITKAFIKLYNPTPITQKNYFTVLPIIKKSLNLITYKKILDDNFNTYEKYSLKENHLQEEYINSMLNTPLNIIKDIIENFHQITNSTELALKILSYIKPKIKKIKKLYVVYSMFIRILFPHQEIKNYFELDATASGLQMTAILFQDKKLANVCSLVKNPVEEDIYDQCSSFFIKNLEHFNKFKNDVFDKIPDAALIESNFILYFDKFLNKNITLENLLIEAEKILPKPFILFENDFLLEYFLNTFAWLTFDHMKILRKYKKEKDIIEYNKILFYIIIFKGLKLNQLQIQLSWLNTWIKSRDFCKKAIMTYGYNATEYRRKEDWIIILLKLNNYERRTDLFFIATISENLFMFITHARLKACNRLKKLGILCKNQYEKNINKNEINDTTSTNIIIQNSFFKMKIHCYKQVTKRLDIKGLSNKRKYQLTIKYPQYIKKVYKDHHDNISNHLIKLQDYKLLSRKFAPNFIHSMDAFIVHIFKDKLKQISESLLQQKLLINHMTNHDNFAFTLEPFLRIILMDCYNILYEYDYIHTLNSLDFYSVITDFKLAFQTKENIEDLLPGSFNIRKSKNIYIPSQIDLDNHFVK